MYVKKFLLNKRDSAMIGKEKIKDITISEKKGKYNEKNVACYRRGVAGK